METRADLGNYGCFPLQTAAFQSYSASLMEEEVGFKPTDGSAPSAVFKTAVIDHSTTLP